MSIFSPSLLIPALAGFVIAAGSASAAELREGQEAVTQLSSGASAVTSFVDRPDGYHLIITVRPSPAATSSVEPPSSAVRFTSRIVPGQTIDLSTADPSEPSGKVLEITRRAGLVAVETKYLEAVQN